jgi:hypothetical protein
MANTASGSVSSTEGGVLCHMILVISAYKHGHLLLLCSAAVLDQSHLFTVRSAVSRGACESLALMDGADWPVAALSPLVRIENPLSLHAS